MPNRYELPNGEIVDVEAKYLNDFIRENPGAILLLQGVSTWRNADGDLINVEGEDLEGFVKNTPGASLYNGSTELKKWYKKAVTPYAEKSVFDVNSWDDFTDWFFIDEDETQEKNTWQETLLGKNQVTDFFGDIYRGAKLGVMQGKDVTDLGLLFNVREGEQLTEEEQERLFKAIQKQSELPVSDEMLTYMNSLQMSNNGTFNMMNAVSGFTPSLMFETFASSTIGMARAFATQEGFAWAAAGAGTGAAVGFGVGAGIGAVTGPGALATGGLGALKGTFSGIVGGLGGVLEATGKVGELVRKEMDALGMEFTYENFQKFAEENPDIMLDIKSKAITKGITVGAVEGLFGAIVPVKGLGKIGSRFGNIFSRPLVRTGTDFVVEGVGGAAGEYLSQKAIGEEADVKELMLEATGGGPISVVSGINNIARPGKYTVDGIEVSRNEMWNILSNKKLTDQDIVDANIKIENDPVLEKEIKARNDAFEILARLPKDKNGNDIISKEDREVLIEYETALEDAKNKKAVLVEVDGKLISTQELTQQIKDIYGKYEGKTEQDLRIGDVKTAKDVQDYLIKTQVDFTASKQKKAGLGFEAFDFADQFVDGIKSKINDLGVTVDEFLKINKLNSIEDFGSADALRFGDGSIFINKEVAVKTKRYNSVGSHEIFHNIVENKFSNLEVNEQKQLISDFKKVLKSKLSRKNYSNIVKRLKRNGENLETSTEWFTYLSDEVSDPNNKFSEKTGVFQSLIKFFNKNVRKHTDYKNFDFENAENMYEWIKTYSQDVKAGKERADVDVLIQEDIKAGKRVPTAKVAASMSPEARQQISDSVQEIGSTYSFEGGKKAWNEGGADNAITEIKQSNYLDDLIAAKFKGDRVPVDFVDKVYTELTSHIRNFNPETNDNLFGWINSQLANKAGNVYNREYKTTTEQRTAKDVDDRTKEGEVKVQVAAEQDIALQELEELDLSPQAIAKREAQENKRKEKVYSKLRQKLGIETGSELYNRVLDASKKALIRAYEAGKPVRQIQRDLKDAANTYIFKEIKNMLGVGKNYIPTIKNLRESIVESMFVADLVQMERNVPDSEKVFTRFVKNLTSKQEVQDAVDQNKLPPSALNTIDKGQSVALYEKVMPTENEFVGFFDQPLVTAQGVRSGLKGTRKDQLAKYLANSLSLDAMLQVAQDPEVAQKRQDFAELRGESIAENDLQVLAATIGRDVNVKFSKSTAVADIDAAIDNSENTDVYLQIKFSKSHRDQYEARLEKKRPDLTEDQRKNAVQSVFDFVDGKDIPNNKKAKYEKMAMHYMANGYLILPEDGYKVIEAERVAGIKKIDPFSYKNPNVLIEENVADVKGKKTDPDKVKTFTNKTEYSNGVVVYDVEDSKQGQEDVRKVIDTHFGKKANPWCLCARDERVDQQYQMFDNRQEAERYADEMRARGYEIEMGVREKQNEYEVYADLIGDSSKELDDAFSFWKKYNKQGNGFKIAFHNGNLVSFRDGNNMQWWDRMDKPTDAVVIKGKKVGNGFKEVIQVDKNKTTLLYTEKQIGNAKNGTYTKKNLDGEIVEITTTKNNRSYGKQLETFEEKYYTAKITSYYDGRGSRVSYNQKRTYKKFEGKSQSEKISFGKDQIRLDDITKWEKDITYTKEQERGVIVMTVEGTVNQPYFEQAQNPDAITDPFVRKNLDYLVGSNERYFPLQGKKVTVIKNENPGQTDKVTINGEVQETRVKFSRSANNEVSYNLKNSSIKFSNTKVKQRDKTIQKLAIEIGKFEEDTSQKFLYETLLFNLSKKNISYEEAVNITVDAVNKEYDGQVAFEIKNILSEGILTKENVNSIVDGFKNITLENLRIESLPLLAKAYNKIFTDPSISIPQKINVLLNFVGIVGRSTRSGKNTPLRTNKMLFDWIKNNFVLPEEIIEKLKPVIFDGYNRKNISKILYDGKEINKYLHTDTIRRKLTSNKNVQEILNIMKSQAQEAFSTMIDILGSKRFTLEEKLAFIERTFLDQMGMMRKTYPPGFYVYGNKYNEKNTKLEHNPPVAEVKEIWKEYAKGIKNKQEVLSWYENSNASVNVISTEMNDALTKAGLSQSRKGLDNRMEHKNVKPLVDKAVKNNEVGNYTDVKQDYALKTYEKTKSAFKFSRSTKNPTKGITILDFDDTLATSSSLIRYTRPDGTKGTLTPEQYASTYEDLLGLGYEFDFSEFNKVVDGKPAPLLNKAKKLAGKFGTKNMFILTARPAASAPAIQKFLKENGLNIPLKNITGLGNSTAEAKAMWVLDKVSEGYNDFYFADDAIQNVKEVRNVLEQVDVKSKVQQAKVKFSKSLDKDFNDIIQDVKGIESSKRFSVAKGRARGKGKGRFRFFIPPSHEDFVGLLYNFIGFGEKGNKHRDFFEKSLIKPLNRGFRELNVAKQAIANDYRALVKGMPQVRKRLGEKILKGDYTVEDAIRVYLFDKAGFEIPGLTKTDLKNLVEFVKSDPMVHSFADTVGKISRVEEGYISPGDSWQASNIRYDLVDATGRVGRAKFFTEFQENADIIFSDENINKIRAAFGDNFVEALQDMLYRIKTGSNRPTGNNRIVNRFLDWINGSVGATMFFNARSAVLQTLSTVNFINFGDNNIFKAAAAFANQKQYWSDFAALFNSDFLKQRRSGAAFDVNANEIAREVAGSKNPVLAAIKYLLNIGFLPTQLADSFAIASGGATFYRNRIKTYLKQGLSQKEAEAKAFIDFQEIAEATQQSARPDMVSQQQTSTLGRIILAFQNVTAQYARLIKKATLDLVNRRRSRGYQTQIQSDMSNISRIIYYGAIQAVIFNALQNALFAMMFDEDEEDEKKTEKFFATKKQRVINGTIDSLLKGLGVGGAVVATIKNYVIKLSENLEDDSFFKEPASIELLQVSPPIGIKIRKIRRAEKNLEWNKDVITELPLDNLDNPIYETSANYIEGFTNIPVARLLRKVQNISAALDSQNKWWQRVAIGLGWSRWDVGVTDNEIKEAKKAIRENNKRIDKETKLKKATPEEKLKIIEKEVFDLNKSEQVKILEANNLDPKKYPKEADRVEAIMKLRKKNEKKIDKQIRDIQDYVPTEKEQRSIDLFKLNKKDQVNMLIDLGLSSKQIKKLKYEEDRVNKIIQLQDKSKSKK